MIKGILTKVSQAEAKTGSKYCTLKVKTFEGEVLVNVWNSTVDKFRVYRFCTIEGEKSNEQGISCVCSNVKFSDIPDDYKNLIPLPPTKDEWNYLIRSLGTFMKNNEEDFFVKQASKLYNPYSKAPAARVNHHAYPGGLLAHTYQMLNMYRSIMATLPFKTNPFIVSVACLFHDYLKLAEYDPKTYDYRPVMFLKGHSVGSSEVLGEAMRQEKFDPDLIMHCQHAVIAHHGRNEWGAAVVPATPEAFLVHHLDMLSGHGTMYEETPNNTKNFGLGTTIFHYEYK